MVTLVIGDTEEARSTALTSAFLLFLDRINVVFLGMSLIAGDLRASSGRLRLFRLTIDTLKQVTSLFMSSTALMLFFVFDRIFNLLSTIHYLLVIVQGSLINVIAWVVINVVAPN